MKMKSFGLAETKLFHFHGIFKNRGWGGGFRRTPSGSATDLQISIQTLVLLNMPNRFIYSETCLKRPLKNRQNNGLKAMW